MNKKKNDLKLELKGCDDKKKLEDESKILDLEIKD